MNKISKKVSIILGLMLTMVFVFSGCSSSSEKGKESAQEISSTTEKEDEVEKVEKIKLRLMTISTDEVRQTILSDYIKPMIEEEYPEWEVEFDPSGGGDDYNNKLKTYNAAGDLPDVWFGATDTATPIINAGNMLDLTDYIKDDGFIEKFAVKDALINKDGAIYSLNSGADTYFTPRIYYNKQIFADNNIEIPTTFDELVEVCKTLNENGVTPVTTPGKGGWSVNLFILQTMIQIEDPSVVKAILDNETDFNNPVIINALDRIQTLVQAGAFPEGISNLDYSPAKQLFINNQAAMWWNFTWEIPNVAEDSNVGFFMWPKASDKYDPTRDIQFWGSPLNGYQVSSKSKNVEAAVKLAELCTIADALYFESTGALISLETGMDNKKEVLPLMKWHMDHYNNCENYLPTIMLSAMDAKVSGEVGTLGAMLLTGEYSAEEFVKDFEKTWEENTFFD